MGPSRPLDWPSWALMDSMKLCSVCIVSVTCRRHGLPAATAATSPLQILASPVDSLPRSHSHSLTLSYFLASPLSFLSPSPRSSGFCSRTKATCVETTLTKAFVVTLQLRPWSFSYSSPSDPACSILSAEYPVAVPTLASHPRLIDRPPRLDIDKLTILRRLHSASGHRPRLTPRTHYSHYTIYPVPRPVLNNMTHLPPSLRLLLLIALSSSTVSAMPASTLFARQKSCAADGFESCGSDFPDNFCCPEKTRCLSLAGGTTVICCPSGAKCATMVPITCSLSVQDPDENPKGPLKTTVFDVELEKCGSGQCCPFGYSCADGDDGKECRRDDDQSEPPKADKPTATTSTGTEEPTAGPSTEPSGTTSPTATGTEGPAPSATNDGSNVEADSENSGPDTTSIIGGVVGACAILLIIAVFIFVCVRKRAKGKPKESEKFHGLSISEPIPRPDIYRAEFMRRGTYGPEDLPDGQRPSYLGDANGAGASIARPESHSRLTRLTHRSNKPRISIPNRFAGGSPNSSYAETMSRNSIVTHDDDDDHPLRTGQVPSARLAPIRAMRASSRHVKAQSRHLKPEMAALQTRRPPRRTSTSENINVFADPLDVSDDQPGGYARETRFTDLMDEADLGDMRRGKPFVPTGKTPRL